LTSFAGGLLNINQISDILQAWTIDGKSKVVGKDCSPMMGSNQGCNAQTLCCDDSQIVRISFVFVSAFSDVAYH
jgi:hypothetical protein